jgi:Flp pilus assembly protein TadG
MINRSDAKQNASVTEGAAAASGSPRLARSRISRGQSMVEFAIIAVLVITVMLLGVQFALLGQTALAVSQGSSALARYASLNEGSGAVSPSYSGAPSAAMQQLLSPTILTHGGSDLTVTIASYTGTTTTTTSAPVGTVDRLVISLSYNAKTGNKIVLPNPFLGILTFPSILSSSDSQLYE